ncbi:hypothetical protein EGW08_007055 [Elysia chlorotica]|uniref:Large ribosomal subunit protein mL64 n=1 Tax=Elysia chlorotica TaxID=188477 RepID=A0A3S0ZT02_ELYCH|nr:hypothetical protein EGW08_007055 [Elysia chlorotica]
MGLLLKHRSSLSLLRFTIKKQQAANYFHPNSALSLSCTLSFPLRSEARHASDMVDHKFINDSDSDVELAATDLKNVSRMSPEHYQQYHGHPPDKPYKDLIHRQRRFASYGSASGEDPRIMWPSRTAIKAMEEEEREENIGTLLERVNQVWAEKNAAEEEKIERQKRVERNMAQMPKWIAEYRQRQALGQMEAKERALKKEVLLEEARDYFGYKIQANDPKFQQMVEEKEEKEKAEAKKRKKEEKANKLAARIAQDQVKVSKKDEQSVL